jgi:hypothetical protein
MSKFYYIIVLLINRKVFKMSFPYLIQGNNIVVVIENKPHTISKTHIAYQKVLDAIKAQDWDALPDLVEPRKVVLKFGDGNVSIEGETLFWKGKQLHTGLSTRMIQMLQEGFPIEPMVAFMENLYKNPSMRAVTELYGFLEKSNLPITPDGHFLAYKKVRDNYFDVHSGTMDNSVGKVVEMDRFDVDEDKDVTCSTGLHFCSMSYLNSFSGDRTVIVKINPADVVSIPSDYNDAKGRACRYEVIGELNVDPKDAFVKPVQETAVGSHPVKAKVQGTAPISGDSMFKLGYSDGFQLYNKAVFDLSSSPDILAYNQGYEKGWVDSFAGSDPKYVYKPDEYSKVRPWPKPV